MDREPVAIPGELSVEQALDEYFLRYRWPWFPVVDAAHRFLGLLDRDRADEVPEISRATSLVSDLLERDGGTFQVRDDAPLDSLLGNQNLRRFGALMAVDADGRLRVITASRWAGRSGRDAGSERRGRVGRRRCASTSAEAVASSSDAQADRAVALDDAAEVGAGGQGAEGLAPVAGEAGGAEGVGDGLVAVADQERGLQGERHPLDDAAGAGLDRLDVAGDLVAQARRRRRRGAARRRRPRRPRRRRPRPRPGS